MSLTSSILSHLTRLGYRVETFRGDGAVMLVAVGADGVRHVGKCEDGDGPDEEYRAACMLAEACGIDLEDG